MKTDAKAPLNIKPENQPMATDWAPALRDTPRNSPDGMASKQEDASGSAKPSPPSSLDIVATKPRDFDGELLTTNELPSAEILKEIENHIVLDRDGKTHTFKSLYSGRNTPRRVLVIFVRHFFCGNCQEYLRTLSETITTDALLRLPISTFITVIGCGDPGLIHMYAKETKCPFPIYTDPTQSLFDALGMTKSLALGAKAAYMKKSIPQTLFSTVMQGLKFLPKGLAHKSGDIRQVGGEFLFEPLDIATPITTPQDEKLPIFRSLEEQEQGDEQGDEGYLEEKKVTWCHRMKTTRDHAEMPELMEVLGLDGQGQPIKDAKRWDEALRSRKGTGLSMASQMTELNQASHVVAAPGAAPFTSDGR